MSAPLILGTNSIKDVGYNVDNSLRFNDGSSDNLSKTFSSAGNRKTFTFSCWFKRGTITSIFNRLFSCYSDNDNRDEIYFHNTNDTLIIENVASSTGKNFVLNRVFRDTLAWYNFILAVDTTQSTESNRLKIYINGTQETSFSTSDYPSLNADWNFANNIAHYIGRSGYSSGSNSYFDGYMSEVVFIDGSQLDATSFGEFDEDSGIWKPIDVSGLTFGTNGFYLDFEDSSALGNDVSGNNNDFTVNNLTSIDQTTDTCTNNFCTLNSLGSHRLGGGSLRIATFSEGNNKAVIGASGYLERAPGTMAFSQGKWYWEVKGVSGTSSSGYPLIGIISVDANGNNYNGDSGFPSMMYMYDGGKAYNAISSVSYGDAYTNGDIIGVAVDLDNKAIWFSKNGTWQNSATQSEIEAGTTTNAAFSGTSASDGFPSTSFFYQPFLIGGASSSVTLETNFGNPPYSVSSPKSDGNGYGAFSYTVPSGYYALNTKNLAEYG